jgi:nucleoid-associated protein YgaU
MSGPEWTNNQPESPDNERTLSHQAGSDHDPAPEPAMDHDHDSPERPDPAPHEASEPKPHQKRQGFVSMVLTLASKIPLPSLGSERHEILPKPAHPPTESSGHARPTPKRSSPRIPFLAMKRETRVGIATLISFVILVTCLIVNKGWIKGKSSPPLALAGPDEDKPAPPVPKNSKDEKQEKGGKTEPTPGPDDGTKTPEPFPDTRSDTKPKLGTDPSSEPATLPPTPVEGSNRAVLGETTPPTTPPDLPPQDGSTQKPPDLLPGPTDPVALPEPMPAAPAVLPATTPESAPPPPETKPKEPEPSPAPTPVAGNPPLGDPPPMTQPVEPATQPPVVAESSPPPSAPSRPVPTEKPPTLETIPATSPAIESSATRASTTSALVAGASWIAIPSGGRRIVGSVPIVSTPSEAQVDGSRNSDSSRVADGPRIVEDSATADQMEPVVHVVRPGENFWTISKLYYRDGRFYKALHAANRKQVPDIRQLWVGTVLRIPPPEALDRSLIDPPGRSNGGGPTTSTVSRTSNAKRADLADDEADLALPIRPRVTRPDPEAVEAPRRPTYKVKDHDTLRSIARDTLNDARRDREIYNLNRDVLDDINVLAPGTTITLPSDANLSRRAAR